MKNNQIKQHLKKLSDEKYRMFHSKLCPNTTNILGVRTPVLRDYAKNLQKTNKLEKLLEEIDNDYYEEKMLKGLLIGLSKDKDIKQIINIIDDYIKTIDNWAVCDTFCASLKITKKHKKEMRIYLKSLLKEKQEFILRFVIVMILDYYTEKEYLQENFKIFSSIKSEDYYVQMAIAWAISISLIKYYEETVTYLKKADLNKFINNKSISKACDSYRIDNKKKNELKKLRK